MCQACRLSALHNGPGAAGSDGECFEGRGEWRGGEERPGQIRSEILMLNKYIAHCVDSFIAVALFGLHTAGKGGMVAEHVEQHASAHVHVDAVTQQLVPILRRYRVAWCYSRRR